MPKKKDYQVIITNKIDNRGIVAGVDQLDKQLTRAEKRAEKMVAVVQRAFKALEKSGIDFSKFEAAQSRIIAADEKALRAVRQSEAQKIRLTEQTRREYVRTADVTSKSAERAAEAQIRSARNVARENQRSYQSQARFALEQTTREERYNQARFRSAQQYYREIERQSNLETRRAAQTERASRQNSQKRIEAVSTVGGGVQTAGLAATAAITAPMILGIYKASEAFGALETQVANISTIKPQINFAEVYNSLNELSTRVPQTASELGEGLYNIFSSIEISQADALKLLEGFAKGATAAMTDTETFGTSVLGVMNAYKLSVSDAAHISDVFFNTVNLGVVTGAELASQLGVVTQSAKAAGVSFDQLGALIVGVTKEGGPAAQNINNLSNFLNKLTDDKAQEKLAKMFDISIVDKQTGKFRDVIDVLEDLKKKLDQMPEAAQNAALQEIFPDVQARQGAQTLISQLDAVKEALRVNKETSGAAEEAYRKMSLTWMVQSKLLGNVVTYTFAAIGNAILPQIQPALVWLAVNVPKTVKSLIDGFQSLSPNVQKGILIFGLIASAVGPVLTILGTLIVAIGSVVSTIAAAAAAVGGFGALVVIIPGVIIGIASALTFLATGIGAAIGVVYGLAEAWENGFGPVASIVAVAVGLIMTAMSPILGLPILIGAMLVTLYEVWETNFGGLRDAAIKVWNVVVEITEQALSAISDFVGQIGGEIVAWWRGNYPLIESVVKTVNDAISSNVQSFLNAIQSFWQNHGSTVRAVVSYLWDAIKTTVTTGIKIIGDVLTLGLELINGNWAGAWDAMLVLVRRAAKFITGAVGEMNSLLTRAIIAVGKWLLANTGAILRKVGEIVGVGLKYVVTTLALLPFALIAMIPKFVSAGTSIGSAVWQGIKDGLAGGGGTDSPGDLGINVDEIFSIPANPLEQVSTGVENLTKSMEKLGDTTGKTTEKATKFNSELADIGNKSAKKAKDEVGNLSTILDAMRGGTMAQESGGNSRARNGRTGATGLFQVMPANIPEWTQATFGRAMTVQQFKDSPQAQTAVFNKYMGGYLEKAKKRSGGNEEKTVRMAAAAWYGGEGSMGKYDNWKRFRADEPSFGEYTSKVYQRTKKGLNGKNFRDNPEADLSKISDEISKAEQDRQTMLSVEAFKTIRQMPDDDLISKYNRILIEQAQKAGKLQPTLEETAKEFKGFSQIPEVSGDISTKPLDRRSQRFLDTDESLNITKRRKELDERRLYLADEILAKENDYILSLQEVQTDLSVETKLLEKRNLSFEAANEYSRQLNNQTKELGDIEIAQSVLRAQNADDQFVAQRRLLASKREQITLEQDISDLQDKLATQGENNALRYQSAWLKAIYDVKEADTRAVESQIESQVRLADAATVHVEQIRAGVLDALASQKTMSETIADEIVGVYEKIGDASDKFLDKTVGKIPIIGGIAKTLARSALTRITTGLLDTFLPGASQSLEKTGNPLLDESKAQTKSLKNIEKAVVGVGNLGSVTGGASVAGGSSGGIFGFIKKLLGGKSGSGASSIGGALGGSGLTSDPYANGTLALPDLGLGNGRGTGGGLSGGIGALGGFISNRFGGSAIGRRLGGALTGAGIGLAVGGPVGALVGGLIGLFTSGGQRKKDEKTRSQGMTDALGAIDKLINDVNNARDFTDAAGVISQGAQIKQSYLDSMSQLKDNKTRSIALRDVSRIEEKLRQLETLAKTKAGQTKNRADSLASDVPTFADGGSISNFAAKNFQNNPLGYLTGPGSARSDSILARVSHGEYVLDAETVRNLGIAQLDKIRSVKGKLKYLRTPNAYADGGAITTAPMTSGGGGMLGGSINVDVRNSFTYNEADGTATVKTDVVSTDASGKEFIVKTIEEEIYRNGKESRTYKATNNVARGNR